MKEKAANGAYRRYRQKQLAKADAEDHILMTSGLMVAIGDKRAPNLFWIDDEEKFILTLLMEESGGTAEC
jgi:hypothetical protein